ncbi:hypothetical protein I546_0502 [Mycobacterium kansasii 732]|nr:hypothetical protein I546_0502 [Mycobacterium kansasii 732]KZS64923.1 hypothetical protein A4G27_18470 [Mycobacterium kansasii]
MARRDQSASLKTAQRVTARKPVPKTGPENRYGQTDLGPGTTAIYVIDNYCHSAYVPTVRS